MIYTCVNVHTILVVSRSRKSSHGQGDMGIRCDMYHVNNRCFLIVPPLIQTRLRWLKRIMMKIWLCHYFKPLRRERYFRLSLSAYLLIWQLYIHNRLLYIYLKSLQIEVANSEGFIHYEQFLTDSGCYKLGKGILINFILILIFYITCPIPNYPLLCRWYCLLSNRRRLLFDRKDW